MSADTKLSAGKLDADDYHGRQPAETNRQYILATLAGEQTGKRFDSDVHAQSVNYQNAWASQVLSREELKNIPAAQAQPWLLADCHEDRVRIKGSRKRMVEKSQARTDALGLCCEVQPISGPVTPSEIPSAKNAI